MVDILTRYLQGSDSEAINKGENPFASYLSNYNVNPYWSQYLKAAPGQQQIAPTNPLTQAPGGGAQNPYAAAPSPTEQQKPTPAQKTVLARTGGRPDFLGRMTDQDFVLSDGSMIPYSHYQKIMADYYKPGLAARDQLGGNMGIGSTVPIEFLLGGM
jgi:hypothetical protein